MDERANYTILVQGCVDENLADWCGPVNIATTVTGSGQVVTTLTGIDTDQAGLVGILRHLHGLGIILLTVRREISLGDVTEDKEGETR